MKKRLILMVGLFLAFAAFYASIAWNMVAPIRWCWMNEDQVTTCFVLAFGVCIGSWVKDFLNHKP